MIKLMKGLPGGTAFEGEGNQAPASRRALRLGIIKRRRQLLAPGNLRGLPDSVFRDSGARLGSEDSRIDLANRSRDDPAEMKAVTDYHLISPNDLHWRPSNIMQIPNADFLERTGSENLSARLWRLPPGSASTFHKHVLQEEFYFVLEGVGRIRVGGETLTVPRHGGVLVGPEQLRQTFNDTDAEVLWLIVGAPEELEFLQGAKSPMDLSLIYPEDPTQLPPELAGKQWPPKD